MSTTAMVEITDVCPLEHGNTGIDIHGRATCKTCTEMRKQMQLRRKKNISRGRHPRETLHEVPVAPFQQRYADLLDDGVMVTTIAMRAGYVRWHPKRGRIADVQRLKKQLGISPASCSRQRDPETGKPGQYYTERVKYDTAVRLCRALWVEYPSEMGI